MALNPNSQLAALLNAPMRPGRVDWIGLRPARRQALLPVETAMAVEAQGLEGDRYKTRTNGKRQVTLIQAEDLRAIASYVGLQKVHPDQLRRNIVTEGINLLALKNKRFRVGDALLEYTGECHPCSRMEESLGTGGYNAVRGHGGITARVVTGGQIRVGDEISVADS
ncbi:MOSC domain-containing protein [Proteobacteria bacterium 005FR1]|nr:MOSC domain-containing protein [Proteobacteria bacterium 005FR1]